MTFRDCAPTWPALVATVHPAATWGDHNLLWVKETADRIQAFAVDRAYHYHPSPNTTEWVTIKHADVGYVGEDFMYFRVRAPVISRSPSPAPDADDPFARELLNSRHRGRLFEINWPSANQAASASNIESRRIFAHRSPDGRWSIIGECPGGYSYTDGAGGSDEILSTSAVWTDNPNAPVRISLHKTSFAGEVTDDALPAPFPSTDLHTQTRGTLTGRTLHWSPETLVLEKNDTLDTIAYRLAFSRAGGGRDNPNFQWAIDRWKEALLHTNPALAHLKSNRIPPTLSVVVPDYHPIYEALMNRFATPEPPPQSK